MFTAKSSGIHSCLLATGSKGTHLADLGLYLKKPAASAVRMCRAREVAGFVGHSCSALQRLDVGDQIYTEGETNGETFGDVTTLQILFLY